MAALGYVVLAVDFRMPPGRGDPGPVADINYAIRWLKGHAGEYAVDPARVGGSGYPAAATSWRWTRCGRAIPATAPWPAHRH